VTDWGTGSRFRDASGRDAFTLYFSPVWNVFVQDLVVANDYFPPKWNGCNLPKARLNKWKGLWSRLDAETYLDRNEAVAVSDFYVSVAQMERHLPTSHPMRGKALGEIYRYLAAKYLHPHPDIIEACDAFHDANLAGEPFAAIHLRGSDKVTEEAGIMEPIEK
jgi:hypothetical protein